jgi:hypothetical protein
MGTNSFVNYFSEAKGLLNDYVTLICCYAKIRLLISHVQLSFQRLSVRTPTMVGENFEIYLSQTAKIVFKTTMVGEHFEIY